MPKFHVKTHGEKSIRIQYMVKIWNLIRKFILKFLCTIWANQRIKLTKQNLPNIKGYFCCLIFFLVVFGGLFFLVF